MLDNNLALLFIRGEAPLMDEKYDLLKHPNIKYTTDGGAPVYAHGGTENAVADTIWNCSAKRARSFWMTSPPATRG